MPIYWAFLTFMLLKPGVEREKFWFEFSNIDKVLHLAIFALLGFTFQIAFPKLKFSIFLQIMLIYAFLTEILQKETNWGRSMENLDIVADLLGIFIGYLIAKKITFQSNY